MKKWNVLGILLCLINTYEALASNCDTIFIKEYSRVNKSEGFTTYAVKLSDTTQQFYVAIYSANNNLLSYTHYRDSSMSIKQGLEESFYPNKTLKHRGSYHLGIPVGIWSFYFPDGKNLEEERIYSAYKSYHTSLFNEKTKKLEREGNIINNQEEGVWKQYHFKSDSVKVVSNYQNGRKHGLSQEYYLSGKLKREEFYEYGKLKKAKMFDENGGQIKHFPAFVYPYRKQSIYKYLNMEAPCILNATLANPIVVSFVVELEGHVSNIEINNAEPECEKALRKALSSMKKWKPARIEDKPIAYRCTFNLKGYSPRD